MTLGTYYELAAERGDDGLERWMDGWIVVHAWLP